jgi:signal transduction histidine kinase
MREQIRDGRRLRRRGRAVRLVTAAVFCALCPVTGLEAAETQKAVLVLYSTGRDAQISITSERELPTALDRGLARALDYYSEYLDAGRFPDPDYGLAFRDFLREKYSNHRFDLVIGMQEVAIEFLRRHRAELFPATPVVFFALNPVDRPISNATGVVADVDYTRTLTLASALQPEVTQVFVVTGAGPRDKAIEAQARRQFAQVPALSFTYLAGLPTADLERRLAQLPQQSIVYYLLVYEDGAGAKFQPVEYLHRLTAVANRPIYSWVDSAMDRGVVGGSVQQLRAQVGAVAALALRVLNGEAAASIPVSAPDLDVNQVDARVLRRWGISEARVPAGTQILFKELTVWERYRPFIVAAIVLIAAQSGLIGVLLVQAKRRRRAEAQVRRSETALRTSSQRIRDLGGRLLGAQEAERSRIARELHDDVSQQAALLEIDLQLLNDSGLGGNQAAQTLACEALERAQSIARTVHSLSRRLHPAKLRLIGLVASLNSLQRDFSESDVTISFSHRDVPAVLGDELALCVFRIVQEAIQNAVKHGAAGKVAIDLAGGRDGLVLTIVDDGTGFDVGAVSGEGLGLISMRERLEPLGGTLKIVSNRGSGTRLEIAVPYQTPPSAPQADAATEESPQPLRAGAGVSPGLPSVDRKYADSA